MSGLKVCSLKQLDGLLWRGFNCFKKKERGMTEY